MNKIYLLNPGKCNPVTNFASKAFFIVLLVIAGFAGNLRAQNVDVTGSVGPTAATYATLGAAFTAVNNGVHTGAITMLIKNNTAEGAAVATLNSSGTGLASYTTVSVTTNGNWTVSGNTTTAIVKLNGADNVTIDGAFGGGRGLTITNTNPSTLDATSCVWVACASASDGATGNTIKNCKIRGSGTTLTFIAVLQSGTAAGGVAEIANTGNTYQNNEVTAAESGIAVVGPTGNESGTVIADNTIGSVVAGDKMSFRSIYLSQQQGVSVTRNTILGNFSNVTGFGLHNNGISVNGTMSGGTIDKNKISNIEKQGIWGCNGIFLNSSTSNSGLNVINNFIWDVIAGGFNGTLIDDNGFGIAVNAGGGYNIQYNSINLATNQPTSVGTTAAIWISTGASVGSLVIRNNIFANQQTNSTRYAIFSGAPISAFTTIDYNDYYCTGTNLGFLGSSQNTLANWQAATSQDAGSVAVNPSFFSATDLHLFFNSPLDGLATPVFGISRDIDNDSRNPTTPDIGADEFTPPNCSGNNGGTATASTISLCATGSATLSATGFDFGFGIAYQWQQSPNGINTWTNVTAPGNTNPTNGNTGTISATRYYRLSVTCNAGAPGFSNVVQITVNDPVPTTTTGGTRCGIGSVNLAATGSNLQWYDVPTGGTPIGAGSPFATPSISATTNFYVSASVIDPAVTGGKPSTNGADGTNTIGGINFTANSSFKLNSVVMYPTGAGTNRINLFPGTSTSGTPIFFLDVPFAGAAPGGVVVNINWTIPPGNYTIFQSTSGANCWRDFFSATPAIAYPYNIGSACTLNDGSLSGFYYFFYNWNISPICEGNRATVTATVTAPPAITPSASSPAICIGSNSTLNVTSANAGYSYSWNPGPLVGPSHVLTPTLTEVYTVTATDASAGPFNGCVNSGTVTITVNPTPTALTVTPSVANVCAFPVITTITTSGGLLIDQTVLQELFETFPTPKFAINGGGGITATTNTTYFQQGAKSVLLYNSPSTNTTSAYELVTPINMTLYNNITNPPILSFYHICAAEKTFDFGYVEYSTDGGLSYTPFATTDYTGTGTLFNGVVSFDASSYTDWNTQFTGNGSTPGAGPATALWKKETINMSAYTSFNNFKIRFRFTSDVSDQYFGWLIDNILITGTSQAPITWSPIGELYSNAAATNPYLALQNFATVYTKPTVSHLYTATADGGTCTKTATANLTVTSVAVGVSITASPSTSICAGTSVTYTATGVNPGTTPTYRWYKSYSTTTGALPAGSTVIPLVSAAGLVVGMPAMAVNGGTGMNTGSVITVIAGNNVTISIPTTLALPAGSAFYSELGAGSAAGSPLNTYTTSAISNGDNILCVMSSNVGLCATNNPAASNVLSMTVNPLPVVSISGANTVCIGAPPTVLTATATVTPGSISTYEWFIGAVSQGVGPSATFNATLPGSYTVIATSAAGCPTTSAPFVVTLPTYTITATSGPNGTISPSGVQTVDCGDNINFTITPNVGGYSILNVLVDGVPQGAIPSYTFTNVGANHTISATFQLTGCATPATASAGPDVVICANATHTLNGAFGGSASSASWSGGTGTFNPNANTLNAIYTPSPAEITAGTVTLTLTTDDPAGSCIASSDVMTITIKEIPTVSITGVAGFCPSGSTTLTAVAAINPAGPISYAWLYNGVTPLGSVATQLSSSGAGTYQVTVTGNGCQNTASVPVVAFVSPTVTITGSSVICTNTATILSANVVAGSGTIPANGFVWRRGGVVIGGATASTISASLPGNYDVRITDDNGCVSAYSPLFALNLDLSKLHGLYTISTAPASCTNYTSFASAINDLNTRSIDDNVRFDVAAGFTETAPYLGLALGAPTLNNDVTTNNWTIVFRKSGAGANPLITAYAKGLGQPTSPTPDGIWSLRGINNVTIDGIDLNDPNSIINVTATGASSGTTITVTSTAALAAGMFVTVTSGTGVFQANTQITSITNGTQFVVNLAPSTALAAGAVVTNTTTMMEYGYGLFKLSVTDGAQNNTIQNCTITLNKLNNLPSTAPLTEGSTGIIVANSTAIAAVTALTPTAASGSNSNNKFYTNTIQNCNHGIALIGYQDPTSPYTLGDTNNDVGGSSALTGNNVINYGGGGLVAAAAIRVNNQWGVNISYNTTNNNNGSGVNHLGVLRGIYGQNAAAANASITNNSITLKSAATTASNYTGIENNLGAGGASNIINISNNTITGISSAASPISSFLGVSNTSIATANTININGNIVENSPLAGTGTWTGISNAAITPNLSMSNNIVRSSNVTASGVIAAITNTANVGSVNMSGNTITGISKTSVAVTTSWLSTANSTTSNVKNNLIYDNTVTTAGFAVTVNCILVGGTAGTYEIDGNIVSKNSVTGISGANAAILYGIGISTLGTYTSEKISNNQVRNLFITGTSSSLHILRGISAITSSVTKNIHNNLIDSLYMDAASSAVISGIATQTGTLVNVFKNKIQNLFPGQSAATGSYARGIGSSTGTTINIHNNMIALDYSLAFAPAANAKVNNADGLKGIELTGGTNVNLYYNTIRLGGTGFTLFGASGIGATTTPAVVTLKNNIVVNACTPIGLTGFATAFRRAEVNLAKYSATSNNNFFYAGVPSPNNFLYYNGTGYQTLATLVPVVTPRETASVAGPLPANFFQSIVNPIDLRVNTANSCLVDGAGIPIAGYTTDIEEDTRDAAYPDMGADEHTGTGGSPIWKGVDTDWENAANWCGVVPTSSTNVIIPGGKTNYPIITTTTPVTGNITINSGGTVTVNAGGKLAIYGTISNSGTFAALNGTIEMAGASAQTIPANTFQSNNLQNLVINNATVNLGGTLNLLGKLSFTGSNRTFATAGNLVLKSNDTTTASVGDITNNGANSGNQITGDVLVERYATAKRAWRLLSSPTQHNLQTIKEAWQENQAANATTPAGFGIQITKDSANWAAYGFDLQTPAGPSVKTYVPGAGNGTWKAITSTVNVPGISTGKFLPGVAYMTFIRGDRTVNTFPQAPTTTVLREKGALITGNFGPVAVGAGQFAAVGNPYASAIDFTKLTKSNLQLVYYLWDPLLGTLGAYQTFLFPNYVATPGTGSFSGTNNFIESGQAFFVRSSGPAGSITFTEDSKVDGSNLVTRVFGNEKQLRTNLYQQVNGNRQLFDGVLNQFDNTYSNDVDGMDAVKLGNFGENIGILRDNNVLVIESRASITRSDTIFYKMGQLKLANYEFEFVGQNLAEPGLEAFLEDRFLNTQTPVSLDGTTVVAFTIANDPLSYASDRFRIVFRQLNPVPVRFNSIKAEKQQKDILVSWKVENELNIQQYEVEKSANGRDFNIIGVQAATGNGTSTTQYSLLDQQPIKGYNYYRVRSIGLSGDVKYSEIVKVNIEGSLSLITVYPNPVKEDRTIQLSMSDVEEGVYQVSLVNELGQIISRKQVNHTGGNAVYTITLDKSMTHGTYSLEVFTTGKKKTVFKIIY